ncbi:MAG: carboxylating nicotinate-nucleotide diphosphorylase [Desulfobulbaceae bacterium]|jgi:nicotinate-nucleotide pyrophosphorylase (carboxylating)|nr:carboxylating nicotinate-nucleotide diphosphorylase [Desulfobulbaceae bacterium]
MNFSSLSQAIAQFLQEDIGTGDVTSQAIFSPTDQGSAFFIAKDSFICAGMEIAALVFKNKIPDLAYTCVEDGKKVKSGDILFECDGPVLDLLQAERVALNLVQRLCGIATLTDLFVQEVKGYPVRIVDTRKTTPGLRVLEKYAVRVGGGYNHRFNLSDGVLIKDNHIKACGSIAQAVSKVRKAAPHTLRIEVEAENLREVQECIDAEVDIIMLDNMTIEMMTQAVQLIGGKSLVEASGGVCLETIRTIASTGVDIISIGALTHSAKACDISMGFK